MSRGLFGKSKSQPDRPERTRPRTPAQAETVLGPRTQFEGTLRSQGDVRVEDSFIGDIVARGQVWISLHAVLDGDLICTAACIDGLVRGQITAHAVTVTAAGRVLGDILTEKMSTEGDSEIQGAVTLSESVDLTGAIKAYEASLR